MAINTSACGFTTLPLYQTALNGASNHWATSGVTTILTPTPTGFRVQVTYLPGPITPATANQLRWQVNWRATPLRHTYTFAGQHIAQRQGKTFTYLHADHLGSTLLATDQTGAVVGGNQPRYAAYGRERTPSVAALPTDYTFTGQKLDGTGLIYMNARYYDPQLGAFISPDSIVPDATSLADYNRYLYARGNPIRYNDPSGHQSPLAGTLSSPDFLQNAAQFFEEAMQTPYGPVIVAAATAPAAVDLAIHFVLNEPPLNYPALYPDAQIDNGNLSVTTPVIGSTTLTTPGVALAPAPQTQSTGVTALSNPAQQVVDPLPAQQKGSNIVFANFKFPDASQLAKRLGVSEREFHREIKDASQMISKRY